MSIPEGAEVRIREVWDCNVREEFAHINRVKNEYPNISIDTEFPGCISVAPELGASLKEHQYQTMRVNVDNMKLIQAGLTLTDERGNLPVIDGAHCIWQFNFREFDVNHDIHAADSIKMLRDHGIDFAKNRRDGIDVRKFGGYLLRYDLVCNRNMRYICFAGEYDFAYMLKLLTGGALLPHTKAEFDQKVQAFFGTVYDVKDMRYKYLPPAACWGGLETLAKNLGIKRRGVSHQAGWDSLLTAACFHKIREERPRT